MKTIVKKIKPNKMKCKKINKKNCTKKKKLSLEIIKKKFAENKSQKKISIKCK